ncbi:hypothetical protein [Halegenticoccus soli]|uniref:hypothetical protein n=1 Tax=Halegenticoccus soli TaxID=1985678 RepID=UPI000C6E6A4A|nr:hypothetical protein [Halegenticoccus soli]
MNTTQIRQLDTVALVERLLVIQETLEAIDAGTFDGIEIRDHEKDRVREAVLAALCAPAVLAEAERRQFGGSAYRAVRRHLFRQGAPPTGISTG